MWSWCFWREREREREREMKERERWKRRRGSSSIYCQLVLPISQCLEKPLECTVCPWSSCVSGSPGEEVVPAKWSWEIGKRRGRKKLRMGITADDGRFGRHGGSSGWRGFFSSDPCVQVSSGTIISVNNWTSREGRDSLDLAWKEALFATKLKCNGQTGNQSRRDQGLRTVSVYWWEEEGMQWSNEEGGTRPKAQISQERQATSAKWKVKSGRGGNE